MSQSKVVTNNCIPYCTSSQSLILRERWRLVWVFNRLRCIINVITERDIAPGSDVVQDNTGTAQQIWSPADATVRTEKKRREVTDQVSEVSSAE
ncbi:hypothetical protein MATL_G00261990 [Megalops atlanticus]|uniref:Uncharacterized protein n=1 Tax=Megalops atlanticus TaxID=7932 RepID=A0A9D3SZD8_MEGAT|nr:hypothetical protein MATL_G00261990 [Megalops atlanticus]